MPGRWPPARAQGREDQSLPFFLRLHSYATSIRKAVLASMDNENVRLPPPASRPAPSPARVEGLEMATWHLVLPPRRRVVPGRVGAFGAGAGIIAGIAALLVALPAPAGHGALWAALGCLQARAQALAGPRCAPKLARLPQMHTPDIGGRGTTSEAIQDIIRRIRVINGRAVEA